ncbi:hypothetical protein L211DRAFT_866774 [Terfezia boudieri ATCC MYA-4762]|uniref:Uncharacterized protein n=1 Tax=Terfezia boudieri ATCC MYA-4762 TaxID=1051890 RepID=A0A3N4LSB8_9PEZI|nr:hypothetical protein L211DRAFT_866774 [Terfezia boudieri ATCC MYA-4762]
MPCRRQCKGITRAGLQCKRILVTVPGSYCWQHTDQEVYVDTYSYSSTNAKVDSYHSRTRCKGKTVQGAQCRNTLTNGGEYCWQHTYQSADYESSDSESGPRRCRGQTLKLERCKRMLVHYPGHYCWQHTGQAPKEPAKPRRKRTSEEYLSNTSSYKPVTASIPPIPVRPVEAITSRATMLAITLQAEEEPEQRSPVVHTILISCQQDDIHRTVPEIHLVELDTSDSTESDTGEEDGSSVGDLAEDLAEDSGFWEEIPDNNNMPTDPTTCTVVTTPDGEDELPTGEDELPTGEDELPTGEDELPTGEDELPAGEDELPAGEDELPAGEDELPAGEVELPAGDIEMPTSENELPTGKDELPTGEDELPAGEDELPAGDVELPTSEDEVPNSEDELPTGENEQNQGHDQMPSVDDLLDLLPQGLPVQADEPVVLLDAPELEVPTYLPEKPADNTSLQLTTWTVVELYDEPKPTDSPTEKPKRSKGSRSCGFGWIVNALMNPFKSARRNEKLRTNREQIVNPTDEGLELQTIGFSTVTQKLLASLAQEASEYIYLATSLPNASGQLRIKLGRTEPSTDHQACELSMIWQLPVANAARVEKLALVAVKSEFDSGQSTIPFILAIESYGSGVQCPCTKTHEGILLTKSMECDWLKNLVIGLDKMDRAEGRRNSSAHELEVSLNIEPQSAMRDRVLLESATAMREHGAIAV